MEYKELKLTLKEDVSSELAEDILASELAELGFESFSSESRSFSAFIPHASIIDEVRIAEIISPWAEKTEWIFHAAQNWNRIWEEAFEPVEVDDFAYVYADFHEKKIGYKHYIQIMPKMSFGTGHHATTRLVMRLMRNMDFAGKSLLDIGTGTGILAILARQLGATEIVGTEIEPWALENAAENFLKNNISDATLIDAAIQPGNYGSFDRVLANINRNTIIALKHELQQSVKAGGDLLMSGFYERDQEILKPIFEELGFEWIDSKLENDWCAMHWKKKNL